MHAAVEWLRVWWAESIGSLYFYLWHQNKWHLPEIVNSDRPMFLGTGTGRLSHPPLWHLTKRHRRFQWQVFCCISGPTSHFDRVIGVCLSCEPHYRRTPFNGWIRAALFEASALQMYLSIMLHAFANQAQGQDFDPITRKNRIANVLHTTEHRDTRRRSTSSTSIENVPRPPAIDYIFTATANTSGHLLSNASSRQLLWLIRAKPATS